MTEREQLAQDLRAHAHEAPAVCAALMRRAASELSKPKGYTEEQLPNGATLCRSTTEHTGGKHRRPKDADDSLRGVAGSKEASPC